MLAHRKFPMGQIKPVHISLSPLATKFTLHLLTFSPSYIHYIIYYMYISLANKIIMAFMALVVS